VQVVRFDGRGRPTAGCRRGLVARQPTERARPWATCGLACHAHEPPLDRGRSSPTSGGSSAAAAQPVEGSAAPLARDRSDAGRPCRRGWLRCSEGRRPSGSTMARKAVLVEGPDRGLAAPRPPADVFSVDQRCRRGRSRRRGAAACARPARTELDPRRLDGCRSGPVIGDAGRPTACMRITSRPRRAPPGATCAGR